VDVKQSTPRELDVCSREDRAKPLIRLGLCPRVWTLWTQLRLGREHFACLVILEACPKSDESLHTSVGEDFGNSRRARLAVSILLRGHIVLRVRVPRRVHERIHALSCLPPPPAVLLEQIWC